MIDKPATYLYNLCPTFFNIMFIICAIYMIIMIPYICSGYIKYYIVEPIRAKFIERKLDNKKFSNEDLESIADWLAWVVTNCASKKLRTYYNKVLIRISEYYDSTSSTC
jgi:hypothetical protein